MIFSQILNGQVVNLCFETTLDLKLVFISSALMGSYLETKPSS